MKRATIVVLSLIFFAYAGFSDAAWHGPVPKTMLHGVLVEATGPVTAASSTGTTLSTAVGTELASGSKINVGEKGQASIMLMDGAIINVAENTAYVVGTPPPTKDKATLLRGITVALNEAAQISLPAKSADIEEIAKSPNASPRVHGMVKMGQVGPDAPRPQSLPFGGRAKNKQAAASTKAQPGITGTYPVETSIIFPETITFMWNPPASFREPVVVVEGKDIPRTTIDVHASKKTEATIPTRELGLKMGSAYSWYLASRGDKQGRGRSRRFPFLVLSKDKQELLARDLKRIDETAETADGRAFLKGQLCFNYGMNYEMVQTLLPLWNKNKSPAIRKLLKLGYARMGQIDEARKYK